MKPIKLLVINDAGISGGGTEKRIKELLIYLKEKGYFSEVHLLQQDIYHEEQLSWIKTHRCPSGHSASFFYTKNLLKNESFDLVHAHNMMGLTPAPLLAAKLKKIPIVFYAHDFWPICAKRNFINPYNAMQEKLCDKPAGGTCKHCTSTRGTIKLWLWRKLINLTDAGICSSKIMKRIFEQKNVLNDRWNVVVPWIDQTVYKAGNTKENKHKTKNNHTILFVGSLIDFKGAWVIVKAMKKIIQTFPNAKLHIIGSEQEQGNVYKTRIDKIVANDETASNVFFLGKKTPEQIYQELRKVTVAVCPTVCFEGFGLTWAEAMASGVPVVASNIGTIPEYVKHNETGILVSPRDDKALADAIIAVCKNPKKAKMLSERGRQYAQSAFQIERAGNQIIALYNTLFFSKTTSK